MSPAKKALFAVFLFSIAVAFLAELRAAEHKCDDNCTIGKEVKTYKCCVTRNPDGTCAVKGVFSTQDYHCSVCGTHCNTATTRCRKTE